MNKKGQLGIIEFKYFMVGLLVGLVGGFTLIILGAKKVIPFKIPFVCGAMIPFKNKKAQLAMIEFKYAIVGFFIGIVIALVLTFLGSQGILPFKIPFVCPSTAAAAVVPT